MTRLLAAREESESKAYSKEVSMTCSVAKPEMRINEQNTALCTLTNKGNIPVVLNVCFKDCGTTIQLGISQEKQVQLAFTEDSAGNMKKEIIAKSDEAVTTAKIAYTVFDTPSLEIRNLSYPESVKFREEFTIQFNLAKTSFSPAEDIDIVLSQDSFRRKWSIEELNDERKFVLNLKGNDLLDESSELELLVSFSDRKGGRLEVRQNVRIGLSDLDIMERALLLLNKLGRQILTPQGMTGTAAVILVIIILSRVIRKAR
jgi:hypothetical protein